MQFLKGCSLHCPEIVIRHFNDLYHEVLELNVKQPTIHFYDLFSSPRFITYFYRIQFGFCFVCVGGGKSYLTLVKCQKYLLS